MAQHEDRGHGQHRNGIFQAAQHVIADEIPRDPGDEQVAPGAVEGVFGRDARIRAAQDGGIGVLPACQRRALVGEVVPLCDARDVALVALDQTFDRVVRRYRVSGFRQPGRPSRGADHAIEAGGCRQGQGQRGR